MNISFCKDKFWDNKLFNNRQYPIFTECFQNTLLIIPTLLFLCLFSLWLICRKYKYLTRIIKIPVDHWYILKIAYPAILVFQLIMEIVLEKIFLKMNDALDGIYIISYTGLCVSLILAMVLMEVRRRLMNPICPILFIFWLSSTLTYFIRFYSNVCRLSNNQDKYTAIGMLFVSGVTMFLFLLSFITDCLPRYSELRSALEKKTPCPEEYASILSKLSYVWLDKYIYRWYKDDMTEETTFDLRKEDEATRNTDFVETAFLKNLKERQPKFRSEPSPTEDEIEANLIPCEYDNRKDPSSSLNPGWTLFQSLCQVFFPSLLVGWISKVVHDILIFMMPLLLKVLLKYVQDVNQPPWQGYCLAVLFLVTGTVSILAFNVCYFITTTIGVRVRAAIIGMVYRKTLRLSNEVRNQLTSGEIINLMSVDVERITYWVGYSWFLISSLVQITIALLLLYSELGFSVFAGLGLIVAIIPLNAAIVKFSQKNSELELMWKDKRVKILTEILNGIKVLKMYAWEPSFSAKVTKLRDQEVKYIRNIYIAMAFIDMFWDIVPFFVMLFTFAAYVYSDGTNIFTAEKAFVSLTVFNLLRHPMINLPWGISESFNVFVSLSRIGRYLVGEEIDMTGIYYLSDTYERKLMDDNVIQIKDGSFTWKTDDKTILKNINLDVGRGKLIAVVGRVGTGKSSLLSAILGEMVKEEGTITVKGGMAYVPQEAWIQNTSLKDNILFTKNYDESFYNKVVEACCLIPDFKQLPAKDKTEIGERGINLSGGQKQRVSLARAVYQNRDVYLLDDPLSAVDVHVGQHLFENVISNNGLLRDKTRILVTHGLNWLPKVDEVIVLNSAGQISERGSFQELVKSGKEFMRFVNEFKKHIKKGTEEMAHEIDSEDFSEDESEDNTLIVDDDLVLTAPPTRPLSRIKRYSEQSTAQSERSKRHKCMSVGTDDGQLIDDEYAKSGTVSWSTYWMYLLSRGPKLFAITVLIYALFVALQVYGNMWLQKFSSDKIIQNASAIMLKNVTYKTQSLAIIRERTNYFMLYYGIIGISQTIVIVLFWFGFNTGNVNASRQLHGVLLKAILRCPMSFFDTTPSGRTLNRFSKDMDMIDHMLTKNISEITNYILLIASSIIVIIVVTPWFTTVILPVAILYYFIQLFYMPTSRQSRRLDSVAASPIFNHFTETLQGCAVIRAFAEQMKFQNINQTLIDKSTKYKFIQFASGRWLSLRIQCIGNLMVFGAVIFAVISRQYLTASLIGLSVSYSLQITDYLNWLLIQYTELETNAVAVERVEEYSMVPGEAAWKSKQKPDPDWPNEGNISFLKLNLRYRDGLPMVLNDIELHIKGGQKIGIVGRTGAGKSSLSLALFRLVEPADGTIIIDNIDIRSLGLLDLRERLTILPQDPVIFSGTLRENLDPFEKHNEKELFESLERSHLKQWVSTLSEGLEYECGEGGMNLSTGQKQLLCLARAILRKSKVLILDEATASVDVETDRLVMETVRQQFCDSTVIIIAHRINTIMDTDKIVVLDQGRVVEYDSPEILLSKTDGVFKALLEQSHHNAI